MGVQGSVLQSPYWNTLKADYNRVLHECPVHRNFFGAESLEKDDDFDLDGENSLRPLSGSREKERIYFSQVQQLKQHEEFPVDFQHLAILWKLDSDKDGSVTLEEFAEFAEFCNERRRVFGSLDFQSKLQAQCDVDMWEVIRDEQGQEMFASWMCAAARQGEKISHFPISPNVDFMSVDAVMILYEMLKPLQISQHTDQQEFQQMFQQIGEHLDYMPLSKEYEELDDYVPVCVVHDWLKEFIVAYSNLFQELGCEPPRKTSKKLDVS
mmetsp:Transcript_104511/g.165061  ORF Transcript_104511/g.165061 Transcript_104511/m.165061 type:complete len:267 (-) Transcript_104511:86-886(-)